MIFAGFAGAGGYNFLKYQRMVFSHKEREYEQDNRFDDHIGIVGVI
jgi:hypothetical protein